MAGNTRPNTGAVRAALADAEPVPTVASVHVGDPKPGEPWNGVLPGQWRPNALGLFEGCPVTPLGVDGAVNWYLDTIGQLVAYTKPYGAADTLELFRGRHLLLYWAFPKLSATKVVDGDDSQAPLFLVENWRNEKAREALTAACAAKGTWNAVERVRGRGIWRGPGGDLVLHCGQEILLGERRKPEPPGLFDDYVYPARPRLPRPAPAPAEGEKNPVKILKPLLESWQWARGALDAHLLLGWIGAAFLGAAIGQRPVVYVVGDKGTGKSTLQQVIKDLFGEWLVQSIDTTAAGIYQQMGCDCLPVAIDEFEGKADSRKAKAVLELARAAYSGGNLDRGGEAHKGVRFTVRSAFLFSSINSPPLEPQDLSRLALLRLGKLPNDAPEPNLPQPNALAMLGRQIIRRLIDNWEWFEGNLKVFRAELRRAGHEARGCDTFGTLLACAHMLEHDGPADAPEHLGLRTDSDAIAPFAELLAARSLVEFEDASENWRGCLDYMLSVPVEAWRNGTKGTVGSVLEKVFNKADGYTDVTSVRAELAAAGLGLKRMLPAEGGDWLAVPNNSPALRKLFEGTKWVGEPGAGVWSNALRQGPRGEVWEPGQWRINGTNPKCTLIKLAALYGPGGLMTEAGEASPATGRHPGPDPMLT